MPKYNLCHICLLFFLDVAYAKKLRENTVGGENAIV